MERRTAILRGKREGAFDRDQYYLERAARARIARKARTQLRRMEPLALVTPRWSQARRFLDDVAVDLLIGQPQVRARTLSLHPLEGRTPHQAWSWLVLAVTEFCSIPLDGPAWQVVSRRGFRHVMAELFVQADRGERRCLMIHGLEQIHVEALRDLIELFSDHVRTRTVEPRFNILLAGSIDAPHFEFAGFERLVLPDFSEYEALETLVEHLGADDVARLRSVVSMVGGIPATLDHLGTDAADRLSDVLADRGAVWRVLGAIAAEIRRAYDIVASDEQLLNRIEDLARNGPQLPTPADEALLRAGLVRRIGASDKSRRTALRAPFLMDLTLEDRA
ncbi:MAG: hypothetical protein ABMB14_21690 [Myxococcota bacterium]